MTQIVNNQSMQECIRLCKDCHASCETTALYALKLGGQYADLSLQRPLNDCAQLCQTAADFMLRGSPMHPEVCGLCAQICNQCADACERLGADDVQLKNCADLCRECAHSCQQMAQSWQPGLQQGKSESYQQPRH